MPRVPDLTQVSSYNEAFMLITCHTAGYSNICQVAQYAAKFARRPLQHLRYSCKAAWVCDC